MILFNIAMFILPPIFAWMIHIYLRHGDMSIKRKIVFLLVYSILINFITIVVTYFRGIGGLNFNNMTLTFRIKYIGFGCVLGIVVPFAVCLLTEDQITFGGLKRYAIRFTSDIKKYFPYAIRAAKSDLKSEVANAYLDWLWWLIEPVCMMLIYTLIFGAIFHTSEQYYPAFIFLGITLWGFFSRNISASVDMVRNNKGIITKVYMPKYILLLTKMFVNMFKMFVSLVVVLLMMIVFRVPPTINIR